MGKGQLKVDRDMLKNVEEVQGLYLSGACVCGKHLTVFVELPKFCEATDESGNNFKLSLAEHIIALCPSCGRLCCNIGNGSRRRKR
jgi:hypothetical protein